MRFALSFFAVTLCVVAFPASAQEPSPVSVRASYPASFFAEVQPQNAMDMLIRVPGFTLDEGGGVRGFGGAAGNVLIDGSRPATKDVTLSEVLRRIPANSIDRIELLDGASTGLQGGGSRLVANVVRRATSTSSGTWRLRGERTAGDRYAPYAATSWDGSLAGFKISASIEGGVDSVSTQEGREALFDGAGTLVEDGPLRDLRDSDRIAGSLGISRRIAGIDAALAASIRRDEFKRRSRFDVFAAGATVSDRIEREDDDYLSNSAEVSIELKQALGRGEAKLIGLYNSNKTFDAAQAGADFPSGARNASRFSSDEDQSESILRANWAPHWPKLAIDLALEGVRTSLVSDTLFQAVDASGSTLIEADRTRVSESRGSAEASASYTGIARWTFEAAIATEASRITLAEPFEASNSYLFFKPRFVATWQPNERWTLSLCAQRSVGQLNFSDFVGAQLVSDEAVTQTNAELQPSQTDALRLNVEHRWGERGSVGVTLVGERIRNVVDVVPVDGGQGVGNLPSASSYGIDVLATVPLPLLVRGAEFTVDGAWRATSVRDPFNGQQRPLQGTEFAATTIGYRHVVSPRFTYGGDVTVQPPRRIFRSRQFVDFREGPVFSLFFETTAFFGLKTRLEFNRVFGADVRRELFRYAGLRGLSPITELETRDRTNRSAIALQLEGTF